MVKVCKLKWNMRAAKAQVSIRETESILGFESVKTHNICFLKTMGCLHVNQTKCFMMMIASFMDLHSIHNLCLQGIHCQCLHCPIFHKKLLLSTWYTTEKSHGLHNIKVDILNLSYHHPRQFLWAFRTRWWVSKTVLMVYSKRITICCLKDKITSFHFVSIFCKSLINFLSVKFFLNRSHYSKRLGKS